jgi:peptidoglycan hydrolase CwlO-like protein
MKNGKIFFSFIFLIALFVSVTSFVKSQTCNNPDECTRLIDDYSNQIQKLQGQGNTLKNQIAQFDAQIKLTSLKIAQTEEQISLLSGRIDQIEGSLGSLNQAFSERAVETYKMARIDDPFVLLLSSDNLTEAFNRLSYLKKIQEGDRDLLNRLQTAKDTYNVQKLDQEDLQDKLAGQKKNLDLQKIAKANLLTATNNDEKKYQQLLSAAKSQLDRFRKFTQSQGGASVLSNQTKCDNWGCYYNQRDGQWGNMYMGGTSYLMRDSGCFITSVSMIASHNGRNILPSDIAQLSVAITSSGFLVHNFQVNGVTVKISSINSSQLDTQLSQGPVMAALYGGDHFIVILRKEGNNYIMHDPFLENGSSRPLTDKYNVSDITSLRLVSFN